MDLSVKIKDKVLSLPIVQGGMGVGISLGNLAGAVMQQGAMGTISAAHPGYYLENFEENPALANCTALAQQIKKAKDIAKGKGLLAVNIMVAGNDYEEYVKASIDAGADAIISGAGLPLDLPKYAKSGNILLAPIVSGAKAIQLIAKRWDKSFNTTMDFVVIEGSKAGGHLGFKKEDLINGTAQSLEEILPQVKQVLKEYEEKYNKKIPVFTAGGIFDGKDIAHFISLGADGVQMGTRFIATNECDASEKYKQAFIQCAESDIGLVKSPAGLPGRAIYNSFVKKMMNSEPISVKNCIHCMKPCNPQNTCYCITRALINAVKGNTENGLIFTGTNGYRITEIVPVKQLIENLMKECTENLEKI